MKLSKIVDESSIDYPEKYGPVFFTSGCNLNCGYCHNGKTEGSISEEVLEKKIKALIAKKNWYSGACICGGEPTLQKDLIPFIRRLKEIGLSVKLDTNGTNPEILERILEANIVDYVAMDVKAPPDLYLNLTGREFNEQIKKSIKIVSQFRDYEFRTTFAPILLEEESRFFTINESVEIAKNIVEITGSNQHKYFLQKFLPIRGSLLDSRYELFPETPENYLKIACLEVKKYLPNTKIRI